MTNENRIEIRQYQSSDFEGLDALWQEAFPNDPPWNRAEAAVPAKLAFQPDLLFVALEGDAVIGSIMAGYDGHRGWLYAVAVRKSKRRRGIGAALVTHAEQALNALGCGKINLQVRSTNEAVVSFYREMGYDIEERISLGKRV